MHSEYTLPTLSENWISILKKMQEQICSLHPAWLIVDCWLLIVNCWPTNNGEQRKRHPIWGNSNSIWILPNDRVYKFEFVRECCKNQWNAIHPLGSGYKMCCVTPKKTWILLSSHHVWLFYHEYSFELHIFSHIMANAQGLLNICCWYCRYMWRFGFHCYNRSLRHSLIQLYFNYLFSHTNQVQLEYLENQTCGKVVSYSASWGVGIVLAIAAAICKTLGPFTNSCWITDSYHPIGCEMPNSTTTMHPWR